MSGTIIIAAEQIPSAARAPVVQMERNVVLHNVVKVNMKTAMKSIPVADAVIVMMRSSFRQIMFLVARHVITRRADAIRILFGYNMGMTIGRALLQEKASLDGATIPQSKRRLDTICFVRTMMQMLMPSWRY